MSRTNIDLDDELIAAVMARYSLRTKREAVDFALRRALPRTLTVDEALAFEGMGWHGDLDAARDAQADKVSGRRDDPR
jgi:Arc/MetJ family transcription regulator